MSGLDKGECALEDIERAKSMVPPIFRNYISSKYIYSTYFIALHRGSFENEE